MRSALTGDGDIDVKHRLECDILSGNFSWSRPLWNLDSKWIVTPQFVDKNPELDTEVSISKTVLLSSSI